MREAGDKDSVDANDSGGEPPVPTQADLILGRIPERRVPVMLTGSEIHEVRLCLSEFSYRIQRGDLRISEPVKWLAKATADMFQQRTEEFFRQTPEPPEGK